MQLKPSGDRQYLEKCAQSVDPLRSAEKGKGGGEDTDVEKAQSNKFPPRGQHWCRQDVEHLCESFVGFRCAVEAVDGDRREVQIGDLHLFIRDQSRDQNFPTVRVCRQVVFDLWRQLVKGNCAIVRDAYVLGRFFSNVADYHAVREHEGLLRRLRLKSRRQLVSLMRCALGRGVRCFR